MKPSISLAFADMWGHGPYVFNPHDNFFTDLFSLKFTPIVDDVNPDILIYSCFGTQHLSYNCPKIFFSGENIQGPNPLIKVNPDYDQCTLSLSKFPTDSLNYYLPLWVLFINWFDKVQPRPLPSNPTYSIPLCDLLNPPVIRNLPTFKERRNVLFINNNCIKDRVLLFLDLQNHVHIDCYGSLFNNVGHLLRGSELDKQHLLQSFKTTIALENSFFPGYNTEKVIQPYASGCIPIYGGGLDTTVFNKDSMIFANDYPNRSSLVSAIMCLLNDEALFHDMSCKPLFNNNSIPERFYPAQILQWILTKL